MMNWKNLLTLLAAASILTSCGGESESKAPDINLDVEIIEVVQPSDNIVNTPLPVVENFDGAADAPTFFNSSYRSLMSESANDAEDNFYHSTAGVFLADGTPDTDPSVWITADDDPHLRLGDGRFTIGQIVSVFAPENAPDPRKDTTPGNLDDTTTSWGELDLSTPYTVSFCVVDRSEGGLFQIYVDNNTVNTGSSILPQSRPVSQPPGSFPRAQRASFNISVGTGHSFIQLRVDSGGWIVIDDLVIENAGNTASAQPDCSTKTTLYGATQDGSLPEGVAFTGLPLTMDFSVGKNMFFGTGGTEGFLAISDEITNPFHKAISSNSRILVNEAGNMFFGNALWAAGAVIPTATVAGTFPDGDIDLSQAYRITVEIEAVPSFAPEATNGFQVMVDNNTSGSANSIHGGDSRLVNLRTSTDSMVTGLETGTLVINVPGNVTMNGTVIDTIDVHRGTANSFLGFRCPSDCGDPNAETPNGIEISSILVEYTNIPFVPAPPQPPTLAADDALIEVSWVPVGGATAYDVAYGPVDDPTDLGTQIIEDITGTSTTITGLTNGTEYFVFVRSQNATGNSNFSDNGDDPNPSATPVGNPPAAPTAPSLTAGDELINVSWAAVTNATAYDVAYNTTNSTTGATEILDVAGTGTTISGLTGGTEYFVFVRAKNVAGTSAYGPSSSATPTTPVAGSWTAANLDLFGTAGGTPSGTIDVNSASAVTITATGGDLGSTVFRAFYAYQSGVSIPFTFTARIASVTEVDNGTYDSTGNSRRYGIYIMENINTAATFEGVGRFAGLELYYDPNPPAGPGLVGSRSEKRDIGAGSSRGRGNTTIAVGDYLRIQVSQPDPMVDQYLVQRFVSTDGVTYTENTTNNQWLNANGNPLPSEVYVGFIAAPNADTLTIEFDNISVIEN